MRLILGADAVIKLNRAGILRHVVETFDCVVPTAVYEEVVTAGLARRHRDADEIEAAITGTVAVVVTELASPRRGLGLGERAILKLLESESQAWVVTDDRPFLAALTQTGKSFFTPTQLLVNMVALGILSESEGTNSLERMRHAIRSEAYWRALEAIHGIQRSHP